MGCALVAGVQTCALPVCSSFAIPSLKSMLILLALAGFGHCLSWVLISRAMAQLRVALIGLLLLLQPVVAFVLDVWLFGRPTEPREWVGLALSLAGIFLASLKGRSRSEEHTSELQSLMRISYAVFCLKKKNNN